MWNALIARRRQWTRRHLLGLEDLSAREIGIVLETATRFKSMSEESLRERQPLRGRRVFNFFVEPSTRTKTSFALAARRLGAEVVDFSPSTSSLMKGESLKDTAKNIEAMGVDTVVIRHPAGGAPYYLSTLLRAGVISGGDGAHEHPTQGLLDIFTIQEERRTVSGLTVALVGDIAYSRVARSNIHGLTRLGARVIVVAPPTLIPEGIEKLGVTVSHDFDAVLPRCDVVMCLRLQLERQQAGLIPSIQEYMRLFGLDERRFRRARPGVLVMHPGPMNRGIEVTSGVADGDRSVILRQVTNGIAVRMAALFLLAGRQTPEDRRSRRGR
jgi:aspartate carbamoyltransferase catalytic subunit